MQRVRKTIPVIKLKNLDESYSKIIETRYYCARKRDYLNCIYKYQKPLLIERLPKPSNKS